MELVRRGSTLPLSHPGGHRFLPADGTGIARLDQSFDKWARSLSVEDAGIQGREERTAALRVALRQPAPSLPITRRVLDSTFRLLPDDQRLTKEERIILAAKLNFLSAKREFGLGVQLALEAESCQWSEGTSSTDERWRGRLLVPGPPTTSPPARSAAAKPGRTGRSCPGMHCSQDSDCRVPRGEARFTHPITDILLTLASHPYARPVRPARWTWSTLC